MPHESDEKLLRRFAKARDRGDDEAAREAWEQLAVLAFDRVQGLVKGFRFTPGGRGLPEHEWGSAASECYLRVIAMGANFRAAEPGRFYAALSTTVHNTCLDYGRKDLRHETRSAGSLDATYEPGEEATPFDRTLARYDEDRRQHAEEALEDERGRVEATDLVRWAIAQVPNEKHREVLELTYVDKLTDKQIAARLDITMDNGYARRSRGLKKLKEILHGLDS
ncbi:MAG: sigma-70 family RNA polymerase sigma factor [Thermoleophilaceae bacterium]|nr:sigma-70 family RNA polymerase sigma factor [Thermoleophilaceae bacterium]